MISPNTSKPKLSLWIPNITSDDNFKSKVRSMCCWITLVFPCHTNGMLLQCLQKEKVPEILSHFHDAVHARCHSGGHFTATTNSHKILCYGYYWPMIFKYAFWYVRKCKSCQHATCRQKLVALPLHTIIVVENILRIVQFSPRINLGSLET